jgi:hypothetical protein
VPLLLCLLFGRHHQSATVRRMTLDTITEVLKYDEKQTHVSAPYSH